MKKKLNKLKLIKAELRRVSLPYSEDKPSETYGTYWIYTERKRGKYPKPTQRSGKWLIFVATKNIDKVWAEIKKATEEGKLGNSAKVATAEPSPLAGKSKARVICVYTYDWKDEKDVKRVREGLRRIGITNKIPYKTDRDTLGGKYIMMGHTRISKYYE